MRDSILLDLRITLFGPRASGCVTSHKVLSLDKPRIVFAVRCVATRHTQDPGAGARVSHRTASLSFRGRMTCVRVSALERRVDLLPSRVWDKGRRGEIEGKAG